MRRRPRVDRNTWRRVDRRNDCAGGTFASAVEGRLRGADRSFASGLSSRSIRSEQDRRAYWVYGADGVAVEQDLLAKGIRLEMTDQDTIVAIMGLVDSDEEIEVLAEALILSLSERAGTPRPAVTAFSWSIVPEKVRSLREAFFAPVEMVSAVRAIGRISADLISPYPPGVPVVAPGEIITAPIVLGLQECLALGTRVAYATDPTLKQFRVLA